MEPLPCQPSRAPLVAALRQQIERIAGRRPDEGRERVSTGCTALDRLLPGGGWRPGTLVEWLADGEGGGAAALALLSVREVCRRGGALVVIDRPGEFYPPAAARLGIDLERLVVVQPENRADHAWAIDQALRCPGVGATLAWPEACGDRHDSRTLRRWQLAVEAGGGVGMLVRPAGMRGEPCWAEARLGVEPLPDGPAWRRRVRIHLLRCRGGAGGGGIEIGIDEDGHETHLVPLAAPERHR
jgi:protein ImuA